MRFFPSSVLSLLILAVLAALSYATDAQAQTRSLNLLHKHTGEELYITFKRAGRYDADALKKLNWFLRDWRKDEPTNMDPRLFDIIAQVYDEVGASGPIHVVSAYRSASTNAMLRRRSRAVAKASQHIQGRAMDFYIPGVSMPQVRAAGMKLQRGGVGFYPGSANLFVHMDSGSVRHWPKVSRDYLERLFPDGRTVHIPADGRPMPGYEQASAEVIARGGTVGGVSGEVGESEIAAGGAGLGGFFAALFGARPAAEPDGQIKTRGRRGVKPQVPLEEEPAAVAALQAEPVKPATKPVAAPEPAKTEEPKSKIQFAFAPMPRPAPSAQERLQQAIGQMAFAPMPLARPEPATEPPVQVAAPLPPPAPVVAVPRPPQKPQVLDPPALPPIEASRANEPEPLAQVMAFAAPQTLAPVQPPHIAPVVPTPPVAPAPVTQVAPPVARPAVTPVASIAPQKSAVKASQPQLVAPSLQGPRGRVVLTAVPALRDAPMAAPNPYQLKLIERPDAVVAQRFQATQLATLPSNRFSGSAISMVKMMSFAPETN